MSRVEGKGNIWAEVVKDSINNFGDRVTTFRLHYHRYIHAEFMTHKMISKNASSSRAIPVGKMLQSIQEMPAKPIHWGLNEPGMQANREADGSLAVDGHNLWQMAANWATSVSSDMWMDGKGFHKQIVNRIAEPFSFINVVATGTDWENFFWLRYHADAAPEIAELARCMYEAREASEPLQLWSTEWHLPYVDQFRDSEGMLQYCDYDSESVYSLDEAQKISSSCCAQASYRSLDQSLDKALGMFTRLVGGKPLHASPFEHPCTPFSDLEYNIRNESKLKLKEGLSYIYDDDEVVENMSDIVMYCANFRGFTQYRKMMNGENCKQKFIK